MGVVGGSRHYSGGGLGEAAWDCPSCGAENAGPIAAGCQLCGAGKPGHRAEAPPPPPKLEVPPPVPAAGAGPPAESTQPVQGEAEASVFTRWLAAHPKATLQEAFTAGYVAGVREMRKQQLAAAQPAVTAAPDRITRTMVAALALFRDQILSGEPEEVTTGEWLSADEVTNLITELLTPENATLTERAHA